MPVSCPNSYFLLPKTYQKKKKKKISVYSRGSSEHLTQQCIQWQLAAASKTYLVQYMLCYFKK